MTACLRTCRDRLSPGAGTEWAPKPQDLTFVTSFKPQNPSRVLSGGRVLTRYPSQARLFDEPQLASLCLENIDKNTADAITAEGFTDIDLGEACGAPGGGALAPRTPPSGQGGRSSRSGSGAGFRPGPSPAPSAAVTSRRGGGPARCANRPWLGPCIHTDVGPVPRRHAGGCPGAGHAGHP